MRIAPSLSPVELMSVKGRSPKHRSIRRQQSQRAPGIREQPIFAAQIYIEAHFAGRKSLL
jgi:hypothetical protein